MSDLAAQILLLKEVLSTDPPDDDWADEVRALREEMGAVTDPWDD